ncbi:hypothetical protein PORUE0001_1434 [Porphyromonas uenonis 60-3]|uniref:DUF58 domain-containing protein n=1 Tax=Porphyromonas uenonis 60-3 TaxID=596327 RepID=C2MDD9_9PORP|nr:DUF58 domain-containing protein [Porphyromonas uenonis]EEK16264.1 hypothetical protein PORUE0001_1434 [Porphyromonas uenonis 60-3]
MQDLLRKVRRIEIKARGLSQNILAGQYRSAFKGRGMAFSEVREYYVGDDVRDIDWNVTARYAQPHVKVFEEERELTIMLLVDVSHSLDFGSTSETKRDLVATIAATIAFACIHNNDRVGLMLYTDRVERYIPAGQGRKHVLQLIREILTYRPERNSTQISSSLEMLSRVVKKRCSAFIVSDFITDEPTPAERALIQRTARRHDLLAIRVVDRRDYDLSAMGLTLMRDLETGASRYVDTSSARLREQYATNYTTFATEWERLMRESGIDHAIAETGEDIIPVLSQLFRKRI